MSKINDIQRGRNDGMVYALEFAKKYGIEALEKEIKSRNISFLPLEVSKERLDKCIDLIKKNTLDTVTCLSAITLHDEFGFGQKRIEQFAERFNLKAECILEDFTTWEEQLEILRNECQLYYKIRWNGVDV